MINRERIAEYITKQKVIDIINTTCPDLNIPEINDSWANKLIGVIREALVELVKGEPAADVRENVKGEWEHLGGDEWLCSSCGYVVSTEGSWEHPLERGSKFCENCGADMSGKSNENYD